MVDNHSSPEPFFFRFFFSRLVFFENSWAVAIILKLISRRRIGSDRRSTDAINFCPRYRPGPKETTSLMLRPSDSRRSRFAHKNHRIFLPAITEYVCPVDFFRYYVVEIVSGVPGSFSVVRTATTCVAASGRVTIFSRQTGVKQRGKNAAARQQKNNKNMFKLGGPDEGSSPVGLHCFPSCAFGRASSAL